MTAVIRSFQAARRRRQAFALLLTLPAVIMAVSPAEVIFIHAHGARPIHHHATTLSDLADARMGRHHSHNDTHEHEGQAPITDNDASTLLIVVKAPMTVKPFGYGDAQAGASVLLHSLNAGAYTLPVSAASPPFSSAAFRTLSPPLRTDGALMGLLLSSHALLL